ncbi:uncharacterized protein LOC142173624 [Nicotiana tabacum]|uniref:Uncharacterized protein LOC142173624 n=1 Tax=Nicotiana tabacum TaxID=4097 RepID=A0AC58TDR1_TOBAC
MAIDDESKNTTAGTGMTGGGAVILNHNHQLYLHPSDGPRSMTVGLLLTGMDNYTIWNRAMKVALLGKNKLCLVDGSTSKAYFGPTLAHQWDRCNAIVTSWLMSNVSQHLLMGALFSESAQSVWTQFKKRFDKVNASRLYYLHKEIFTSTRGVSSVLVYFTKLTDLWVEYDSIFPPPPAKDDVEQLQFQRLFQFLMGLNNNFEQARSQILMMPTIPTINQAYAMVIQDKSPRMMTENSFGMPNHNEPTAMFTIQARPKQKSNYELRCDFCKMKGHTRDGCYKLMKCDYCNKTGYLKENCYRIFGYPTYFKSKRKVHTIQLQGNNTQDIEHRVIPPHAFTREQYAQIL